MPLVGFVSGHVFRRAARSEYAYGLQPLPTFARAEALIFGDLSGTTEVVP